MKKIIRSAYTQRQPVNNPLSGEPTRVKQEFKNEVDINEIVARMRRGISPPPWMTSNTPRYGDFSNMPSSFQEAYAITEAGEAAFRSLPLDFRRALDHNPRNLDKAPRELYEQFGLIPEKKSEEASPPTSNPDRPSPAPQGHGSPPSGSSPKATNKAAKRAAENADD